MADRGSSNSSSSGKGERISKFDRGGTVPMPPFLSIKGKHVKSNAVHRTTSESLRLEAGNHLHDRLSIGSGTSSGSTIGPGTTVSSMMAAGASSSSLASSSSSGGSGGPILRSASQSSGSGKPKTSSFQITSVVTIGSGGAGGPRISSNSNDNGDDSADDLDESHAEDKSVITDETPSFSEDTFSKEDVFFTSSDAIGSAPVIPTSSQYGLAIVTPNLTGPDGQNLDDVHVSVTDAGINLMTKLKKDVDLKDIQHRNERFKVVKIESTEPFRRGRWICMDYLDHSTLQPTLEEQQQQQQDVDGSLDTGGAHNEDPLSQDNDSTAMTQSVVEIQGDIDARMTGDTEMGAVGGTTTKTDESPGQSLQQPLNVSNTPGKPVSGTGTDTPQTTSTTSQASGNSSPQTNTVILANATNTPSTTTPNNFQQGQSQPAQYYSQQVLDQQIPSQQQQQQQMLHHGATLPANILQAATSTTSQNTQQQSPVLPQQLTVSVDSTTFHQQQQDSPQFLSTTSPQTQPESSTTAAITTPSSTNIMHNGPISVLDPPTTLPLNNSNNTTNIINSNATTTNNSQNVTQSNEPSTAGSVPASNVQQQQEAVSTIESNNPNDNLNSVSAASASVQSALNSTNSTLISPSSQVAATLQQGQSLPQQLIQNIVAEDGSVEDSERNARDAPSLPQFTSTNPETTPANMVMRGGRLRYLTVPLIDPLPTSPVTKSESNSANSSTANLAEASLKSTSTTDVYTNIALGNCFDSFSPNPNTAQTSSTPTCHNKSIQKLIKEEKATCPIAIPQRGGSADNLNQIPGSSSGRSSPAHSFSTPNSPPKYSGGSGSLTGTMGDHRFSRAPSPLLQVTQACDHRYVKNITDV